MQYQPVKYWAKLPHPMLFAEATSVAVDSEDNVYVFNRGKNPLIIFDKQGKYRFHGNSFYIINQNSIKIIWVSEI